MEQLLAAHQYRRRSSGKNRSQLSELVFHELHSGWSMETAARSIRHLIEAGHERTAVISGPKDMARGWTW